MKLCSKECWSREWQIGSESFSRDKSAFLLFPRRGWLWSRAWRSRFTGTMIARTDKLKKTTDAPLPSHLLSSLDGVFRRYVVTS